MEYPDIIQNSIDFIEDNLKAEITAGELARGAGFSVYHFYRLFQSGTGMPVMQYILRRRLLHAIYAIRCGMGKTDAAMDYGFDTYAGFYKAFRREFGCTPSDYIAGNRAKKPVRPNLRKEELMNVTHRRAAAVLANWNLREASITDIYHEGSGNRCENAYYVGEEYVLKFTGDESSVQKQIALSESLAAVDVQAAEAVPTTDGHAYVEDGGIWFWLTPRLKGGAVRPETLYGKDYGANARFIGEILGQLHLALAKAECPARDADLTETVRSWALPLAAPRLGLDGQWKKKYLAGFEALYPALPRQIIHRDPNPGNIILSESSWGFIDFDLAERNARIYDPCYAATAILSETYREDAPESMDAWLDIYRDILLGYDAVCRLTAQELEALPYLVIANQLVCVAWFAEQEQYAGLLKTNIAMTRWLIRNFDRLKID